MIITSTPVDEGAMPRRKRPTSVKRRATRPPQYTMRMNILLTQEQFVKLQELVRAEGRPLPNLVRRIIDLHLARRE
jgi:hypothetical protein